MSLKKFLSIRGLERFVKKAKRDLLAELDAMPKDDQIALLLELLRRLDIGTSTLTALTGVYRSLPRPEEPK